MVKPGSKYFPIHEFLRLSGEEMLTVSFQELEILIDDQLPISARKGRSFWSNRRGGAPQAAAWMDAGYHVVEVDLDQQRVRFGRPSAAYEVREVEGTILWDGAMVRALRAHLGLNQSAFAELLGVRQQTVSEWETAVYAPTKARSKHLMLVAERAAFPFKEGGNRNK
jgi:DNA-binding transcriptional regulator YiaG